MPHFPKPAEGSWTEHFELDTGPVSYADSISPEHYELERDAIFRRTWLNVGRVEQLPKVGSYFTKEIDAARTSIVVVRSADSINAFYNICRHRGNKLVWTDFPREETSGTCRQFTCKYHGWRYDLGGACTFVQQEEEFFDLDKSDYSLVPVQADVWEGFIFVNLDASNTTPLRAYMGEIGAGLEGYPFHELTQVHKYSAEIGSNWKLFIDAFTEFYHAPVLHQRQATAEEGAKLAGFGYEALAYQIDGPHGMVSSWGGMSPPKDLNMVKPIERVLRSGLFGPWDGPDFGDLPPGINPSRMPQWGTDSFLFFPNFMVLIWKTNWVITYHYWPTSYNTHIFEGTCYFAPPKPPHEVAHQWWGNVVGWSSYRDQWITEGLANYVALLYAESKQPNQNTLHTWLAAFRDDLVAEDEEGDGHMDDAGPVVMGNRLRSSKSPQGYARIVYGKGAWIFHMLRMMLREPNAKNPDGRFGRLLTGLMEEYRYKALTTEGLQRAVEKIMTPAMALEGGKSMDWFFDQFVRGNGIPEYEVEFTAKPLADGTFQLKGKLKQSGVPANFVASVPLYMPRAAGKLAFLGNILTSGESTSFQFTVRSAPKKLLIDPHLTLLAITE